MIHLLALIACFGLGWIIGDEMGYARGARDESKRPDYMK